MAIQSYIRPRKGTSNLIYRRRIPADLVKAGIYGKKKEVTKSLGTSDRREASVAASRINAFYEAQWKRDSLQLEERKPRGKGRNQNSKFIRRINPDGMRKLSSLSKQERNGLILAHFVELEERANFERKENPKSEETEDSLDNSCGNLVDSLSVLQNPHPSQYNPEEALIALLAEQSITTASADPIEVSAMADLLTRAKIESLSRSLEDYQETASKPDPFFSDYGYETEIQKTAPPPLTLAETCWKFLESKKRADKAPKTLSEYENTAEILIGLFGSERNVSSLTPEDGEELIQLLRKMPKNVGRRYKKMDLREAIDLEARKQAPDVIGPKRIENVYINAKSILQYAEERSWIARNPFKGNHLKDQLPRVRPRKKKQFSADELNQIFCSEKFQKERGRIGKGGERIEGKYWVFMLSLLHGFRQDEACALRLEDIDEGAGIPTVWIRELVDGDERIIRLKNEQTSRTIPLHPKLIELDFLGFVRHQKEANVSEMLFPEFGRSKMGKYNGPVQKWFPRLVGEVLGLKEREHGDLSNHSLRHSFTDALRRAEVPEDIRLILGGRSNRVKNSEDLYGNGHPMEVLEKHLSKVAYPDVDYSPLSPKEP